MSPSDVDGVDGVEARWQDGQDDRWTHESLSLALVLTSLSRGRGRDQYEGIGSDGW
jgi:hypothetical protein